MNEKAKQQANPPPGAVIQRLSNRLDSNGSNQGNDSRSCGGEDCSSQSVSWAGQSQITSVSAPARITGMANVNVVALPGEADVRMADDHHQGYDGEGRENGIMPAENENDGDEPATATQDPSTRSGDETAITTSTEELTQGGHEHDGEILLDAEVELVSPAPATTSRRRRRSSTSDFHRGNSDEMLCGVPVAQPVRHGDDADSDRSDETDDGDAPEGDVENGLTSSSHLQYFGQDVVIATRADSKDQGQANNNGGDCDGDITSEHEEDGSKIAAEDIAHARKKRRYIWGGITLGILVTVAAAGIILGTQQKQQPEPPEIMLLPPEQNEPSSPPPPPPDVSNEYMVLIELLQTSLSEDFGPVFENSPEHLALQWLKANSSTLLPKELRDRLVQRYALSVLYYSTGGPVLEVVDDAPGGDAGQESPNNYGWTDQASFLSPSKHECDWVSKKSSRLGVKCDENMHVIELNLQNNGLSGSLPQNAFSGLPSLRIIDLSNNPTLGGSLPTDLGYLPVLNELALARNAFTGVLPSSYGNLTSLTELNLVGNLLSGSIPMEVRQMTSLSNIWLNQNAFKDGMNNFCTEDIEVTIFYADCFCRNFPKLKSEVECSCCTICCLDDETCHPNVPCNE